MKNYNFYYPLSGAEFFLQTIVEIGYALFLWSLCALLFYGMSEPLLIFLISSAIYLSLVFYIYKVSLSQSIDFYMKWIVVQSSQNDYRQEIERFIVNDADKLSVNIIKKALGRGSFRLSNKDVLTFSLLTYINGIKRIFRR